MNTKAISLSFGLAVTAALAIGGGWYFQNMVAKNVQEQIQTRITKMGGTAEMTGVSYSLLSNTLEVNGIKAIFPTASMSSSYTADKVTLKNPNRSLLLSVVNGDVSSLKGTYPVADSLTVLGHTNSVASKGVNDEPLTMVVNVPQQSITGIAANMDELGPVLGKDTVTDAELMIALALGLNYAERAVPKGSTGKLTSGDMLIDMSTGPMGDKNYSSGSLESAYMSDLKLKFAQPGVIDATIGLKDLSIKQLYISPAVLKETLKIAENPSAANAAHEKLLQDMFLGERPFLGSLEMKELDVKNTTGTFKMGGFRYENSSTKPFTFSAALDHMIVPVALLQVFPEFAEVATFAMPLLDGPDMDISTDVSGIIPVKSENKDALTKVANSLTVANVGTVKMRAEGKLDGTDFLATQVEVSYTDSGLMPRGVSLAGGFFGLGTEQAVAYVDGLLKAEVAKKSMKPQDAEALKSFMQFPGTISVTVTAKEPTKINTLLDSLTPTSDTLKLEVTKGEKPLEELIKASK